MIAPGDRELVAGLTGVVTGLSRPSDAVEHALSRIRDERFELNRRALAELRCEKELAIVPGASHLFAEPGALEVVARLARDWLERHLRDGSGGAMLCDGDQAYATQRAEGRRAG